MYCTCTAAKPGISSKPTTGLLLSLVTYQQSSSAGLTLITQQTATQTTSSVWKINSARALDQDYLHACHCAFFFLRMIQSPMLCSMSHWKTALSGWGVSLQYEWKGDDSVQKHTDEMVRGGVKQKKGICRRKLAPLNRCSFAFSLQNLCLKIVWWTSQTNCKHQKVGSMTRNCAESTTYNFKATTSVKGCGLWAMRRWVMGAKHREG